MRAIVHRTPGLLDLRALTVMGLSAKPRSDNPIGMFGTGLKYAIATLCRLGCSPVIWIGRDKYTFSLGKAEFRGQTYQPIRMKLERPGLLKPRYTSLPYTTEYGKFWTAWMAFRELESNTRDEGGETWCVDDEDLRTADGLDVGRHTLSDFGARDAVGGAANETRIVVDLPEYVHAWTFRGETFLEGATRVVAPGGPKVEWVEGGPRDKLYWRGLRVMDLAVKKTVRCWNILSPMELTEDRTLKHEGIARGRVAEWVATQCEDAEVIRDVITADGSHWEHRLDFASWVWQEPSALFRQVYEANKASTYGMHTYMGRYSAPPPGLTPWERHPTPWRVEDGDIVDNNNHVVMTRPPEPPTDWEALAKAMVARVNTYAPPTGAEAFATAAMANTNGAAVNDEIPF